jgi:hypothetical protein
LFLLVAAMAAVGGGAESVVTAGDVEDCSVSYFHAVCRGNGTSLGNGLLVPAVHELVHLAGNWRPKVSDLLRSFPVLQVRPLFILLV